MRDKSQLQPPPEGVSCVVPVYNEAGAVAETMRGAAEALKAGDRPFELILVDDGSTDGSLEAAREAGVELRELRHSANLGYGAAVKTGCRAAAPP